MVPIEPLRDPEAPFLHILQGLVRGLRVPLPQVEPGTDAPATPLERILWGILRRAVQASRDPLCEATTAELGPFPSAAALLLRERWPRLVVALRDAPPVEADPDVWAALCRFPDEPHLFMRWLGGSSLPEEELRPLGVAGPLEGEERAFQALSTLLRLSGVPIVLGFDQLEGVTRLGDGAVERFLQALGDQLYGSGGRAAVLLFCQADTWNGFAARLQNQVRDRLMQRPYLHLGSVDPALGEKLIERRLEALWRGLGQTPPHPSFPFAPGQVRAEIEREGLKGPRRILAWFAARGFVQDSTPPPLQEPSPEEVALAAFERLQTQVPERTPDESAAIALAVLRTVLREARTVGDVQVIGTRPTPDGVTAKLARGGAEVSVYAEASNSRHGGAGKALAKRFQKELAKTDRAVLLRDEKIPMQPLTARMIGELGGRAAVVRVDEASNRAFSAIEALLNGAASKDLEVPPEVAMRLVVEQIAPRLTAVRSFLDQATGVADPPAPAAAPTPPLAAREALVLASIAKAPFIVAEAQLATAHGLSPEEVAEASDALERAGKATVQRGKDGGRAVLRRPR
jgi:hypothetical protein